MLKTDEEYTELLSQLKIIESYRRLTDAEFSIESRITNYLDGKRLGLTHFHYSGMVYEKSCGFCRSRVGKLFTIDDLYTWSTSLEMSDISNYDPVIHLGGNKCFEGVDFCNHTFRFISNSLAKEWNK